MFQQNQVVCNQVDAKVQKEMFEAQMKYQQEATKAAQQQQSQAMIYAHQEAMLRPFVGPSEIVLPFLLAAFTVIYCVRKNVLAEVEVAKIEASRPPDPPEVTNNIENNYYGKDDPEEK